MSEQQRVAIRDACSAVVREMERMIADTTPPTNATAQQSVNTFGFLSSTVLSGYYLLRQNGTQREVATWWQLGQCHPGGHRSGESGGGRVVSNRRVAGRHGDISVIVSFNAFS